MSPITYCIGVDLFTVQSRPYTMMSCTKSLEKSVLKVKHEICFPEIYILFILVDGGLPYEDL